jgi:hypothetical protein
MKRYSIHLLLVVLFALVTITSAQAIISDDGDSTPESSTILELKSTSKGFLPPRLSRGNVSTPQTGMLIYDTDDNKFYVYNGVAWVTSGSSWLGSTTRIKLLPKDFVGTLTGGGGKGAKTALSIYNDNTDNNNDSYAMTTTVDGSYLVAFVSLPTGYKATSVKIYGTSTSESFYVYEGDITTTSNLEIESNSNYLGTAEILTSGGLVTFSSAISSTDTNYLIVAVSFTNTETDQLFGGYVTIEPE